MTDLEKVRALLTELKVKFSEVHDGYPEGDRKVLRVDGGYTFFFTEFRFTPDGKFVDLGAYE